MYANMFYHIILMTKLFRSVAIIISVALQGY